MGISVGIAGVSGYAGIELLRVLRAHPAVTVRALAAGRAAGGRLSDAWPGLGGPEDPPLLALDDPAFTEGLDLVFLALPHGVSMQVAPRLLDAGLTVIDLGADFRLRDRALAEATYGPHAAPQLLDRAVYGLPELNREALRGAKLVACPGCYPTATALAALPLVEAGLADFLVADCLSGISGAGRKAGPRNLYGEVQEQARAYAMAGDHRHVPEIEQVLGVPVAFTPHLVPMVRGMLATVTARLARPLDAEGLRALFAARYADHPMVTLRDAPPSTAEVRATARACVFPAVDARRGVATVSCAIDNLGKGAAGQAVHAMNIALGLDETLGLPTFPPLP